jgi:hypothetical protein
MLLKAPPETTYVQTPVKVYPIDNDCIDVTDKEDLKFFLSNGFTKAGGASASYGEENEDGDD